MNPVFQSILDKIKTGHLSDEEKEAFIKTIKDSDKSQTMLQFKLERTEKDKHTLQVMLEESIEDLQKKSRAIEAQNRELEIESSLEKVRTIAMGIRKRDDMLDVCRTISQQLESLGIKEIRNVQTAIFYQDKGTYVNYEYYRLHDTALVTEVEYTNDEISIEFATQMIKGSEEVFIRHLEGQQVKDWLNFQKTTNVFIDTHLEKSRSLTYHWFSLGPVAIGASTYEPLSKNEIELFKRFRNVFELAYRRYLDIEKAEAQAREAQIQLALERVRARTMAMQKSDELQDVVHTLYDKLHDLNIDLNTVFIIIFAESSKDTEWWLINNRNQEYPKVLVRYTDQQYFRKLLETKENGTGFFSVLYSFDEKNEMLNYLFEHTDFVYTPEEQKQRLLAMEAGAMSVAIAKNIAIHITRYSKKVFSDEENDILRRFTKVFDQAYTRFLDLQKAEAQARESQIQLALERVRARTMAMQRSEELMEAANLLLQQVQSLGIPVWACGYNIWEIGEEVCTAWMSVLGAIQPSFRLPLTEHRTFIRMYESRLKGEAFYVEEVSGQELGDHYRYMFSLPDFKEIATKQLQGSSFPLPQSQTHHVFNFKHGNLIFLSAEAMPGSWDIFKRFTDVFEQTYTRFLDLQKAEAQAREGQIQLALERVRARTMAMQKSDELTEVAELLFKQVNDLGIKTWTTGFNVWSDDNNFYTDYITNPQGGFMPPYTIDAAKLPVTIEVSNAKKRGDDFFISYEEGEALAETYGQLMKFGENQFKSILESGYEFPSHQYEHFVFGSKVSLMFITYESVAGETHEIFKRFGKVFEQTYTRFLDLQKAEAQAREAQIEAALERVRSRTMAMHNSSELLPTAELLFDQLKQLGAELQGVAFAICDKDSDIVQKWTSIGVFSHPYNIESGEEGMYEAWKNQAEYYEEVYEGERQIKYYETFMEIPSFKQGLQKFIDAGYPIPTWQKNHAVIFKHGYLLFITIKPFDETQIFLRFGKVFEQTYTRFLDLQKAEMQARENQIQLALERARTQSMIMQHSTELDDTLRVFHEQVLSLGIPSAFSFLWLPDEEKDRHIFWAAWAENNSFKSKAINYPLDRNEPATAQCLVDWKSNEPVVAYHVAPEGVAAYFTAWSELIAGVEHLSPQYFNDGLYYVEAFMKYGCFGVMVKNTLSEDEKKMLSRFAAEFERTYTRFLDLQKSESQAKESQIQLALERVRARTMAMQHSNELKDAALLLFQQVQTFGVNQWACGYNIWEPDGKTCMAWMSRQGTVQPPFKTHPAVDHCFQRFYDAKQRGESFYVEEIGGEEIKTHYKRLFSLPEFKSAPREFFDEFIAPNFQIFHIAYFDQGYLMFISYEPVPEVHDIFKRFAKVFEQTYTRFLDLQKAEAQARESQIEAALERVRSRTMAMHQSEEIADIVGKIFGELRLLDLVLNRVLIWIFNEEEKYISWWSANPESESNAESYRVDFNDQPVFLSYLQAWQKRTPLLLYTLSGDVKKKWEDHLFSNTEMAKLPVAVREGMRAEGTIYTASNISDYGLMMVGSFEPLSAENIDIIQRFGRVFQQSYTRYLDVQKAEAQALEAIKHASVDRVRAEIASMRTTKDLERITPLIWNELTTLGVPFIRCGVFIMDEAKQQMETHLSTPGGESIAAFKLSYNTPGETSEILAHWYKKELYKQHWDEKQFVEFTQNLVQQGAITGGEKYLTENRPTDLYLHFLPFLQGMLYVGNTKPLSDGALQLVQNLADAFSTAYARYEDFNKLEAAKRQVDSTLNELQATQKQLIQSEKMASLGELTAGIAHEIQNPLNFVNNFSEVNNELIEELLGERSKVKGERDEVVENEIINDIKQNLEKINHHGKRADSIVKGMLQHSRSTSTIKEPTDINALADEYLRLAYHGLRAKDKSFNTDFKTDFDNSIDKINIIPQDIGRVLLNFFNNAFYAVNEKLKTNGSQPLADFKPVVSVRTKKVADKIEIIVRDNGNGIPQRIVDKIFQPFFTTKPTGQGTGLGLSLAYDIVKAHGGEIKVETKEGEGSAFIIQLPVV